MTSNAAPNALPKYVQVSEMLIREIAAGHLADGARLPPERDMAAELGVSVGTLRKSLADLEEKGMLDRIHGSGNYVRHKASVDSVYGLFRLELLRGGGLPTAQVLSVDRMQKPTDTPKFGPASEGHRIRRIRSLGQTVVALEEIWIDGSLRDQIDGSDLSDSLYLYYRDELGLVIASVTDQIGVGQVPDWTPAQYHQLVGAHCGFIERLGWNAQGDTVEFSRTWFDSDRARYVSRMGKG